jgi:hypothetical protein
VPIEWKQAYRTALQEKDYQRLGAAVRLESAIQTRLQELESLMGGGKSVERAELKTAIRDLQAIKAKYPAALIGSVFSGDMPTR